MARKAKYKFRVVSMLLFAIDPKKKNRNEVVTELTDTAKLQ